MSAPLNARQIAILGQVRQAGRVFVDNLAETFATTPQTIRRDLQALADTGEVMRFHGGASLPAGIEYTGFDIRSAIAVAEKDAIGRCIAGRIPNNSFVMINAGTTTAAVARALKNHAGLRVITDNVGIANDLRLLPGIEVLVPGGMLRRSDGAILGEETVNFISQFRADMAIIGAAAVDEHGALLDFDISEVHVTRAMMHHAKHVVLAVDSSKFSRSAPICIGHLSDIHTLVTDRSPNGAIGELCARHEVELVEARPGR
ncbi:MAG: DeoR/GlpR family DNA-binding transcription regulator [Rhizobiaceae bacterium]